MTPRRDILALDCDSVLFPVNELVVLPYMEQVLGYPVDKQEITTWRFGDIPRGAELALAMFTRPDLYDEYDAYSTPGLPDALAVLRSQYRVLAVSVPFAEHAGSKWRYLRRLGFGDEDIVLCGDKRLVGFDVLVDDKPYTAEVLGPSKVVVFDQPWNRTDDLNLHHRAYDWPDVPRKVARLMELHREVAMV